MTACVCARALFPQSTAIRNQTWLAEQEFMEEQKPEEDQQVIVNVLPAFLQELAAVRPPRLEARGASLAGAQRRQRRLHRRRRGSFHHPHLRSGCASVGAQL